VSPCLSNIFLHHVLDEWFENEVKPRLKGKSILVRFADDAVMAFADYRDAQRVLDVLGKRLARYGLTLPPDKTRFIDFRSYRSDGKDHPEADGSSFTFLGFCHVWGKSRKRKNVVRQVTAKQRYARALAAVNGVVPGEPASADPRAAHPTGRENAGPLCLLRYIGQLSPIKLVRPSTIRSNPKRPGVWSCRTAGAISARTALMHRSWQSARSRRNNAHGTGSRGRSSVLPLKSSISPSVICPEPSRARAIKQKGRRRSQHVGRGRGQPHPPLVASHNDQSAPA
jgi:reverse transcriptase-like protein